MKARMESSSSASRMRRAGSWEGLAVMESSEVGPGAGEWVDYGVSTKAGRSFRSTRARHHQIRPRRSQAGTYAQALRTGSRDETMVVRTAHAGTPPARQGAQRYGRGATCPV